MHLVMLVPPLLKTTRLLSFIVLFFHFCRPSSALYRSKDVFSCFILHSNEFLEKSGNVLIENVADANECLRKCIQAVANHKIRCKTVMYNVNTKNCVLSKHARHERNIKKSKGLQIDLYENRCASAENETVRLAVFTEQTRTTFAPFRTASTIWSVALAPSNIKTTIPPTITTQQTTLTTNELRRVHAVKQYPLDKKNGNIIFSKTVYADISSAQLLPQRTVERGNRIFTAKVFLSPRPLVDSTSTMAVRPSQQQIQADTVSAAKQRRQRSQNPPIQVNFAACFMKISDRVFHKFEESRIGGVTLETCMRQCSQNYMHFYCASVNYSFGLKVCILNGGNLHLNGDDTLMVSKEFDYFENTCQPRSTTTTESSLGGSGTKKECYRLYNNSIYNSFDATIVGGLQDLESCESECSWSYIRRRERCVAVNWIQSTRGCMLFYKPIDFNILLPSTKSQFLVNICTYTTDQSPSRSSSSSSLKFGTNPDYYDSLQ